MRTARIEIEYSYDRGVVELPEAKLISGHREAAPPVVEDLSAAVRQAVEEPLGFPPLARALTPDDHITVVVSETLHRLPELVPPILQCLIQSGIAAERVTLLCPPRLAPDTFYSWRAKLPAEFEAVQMEVHEPAVTQKMGYLASTKAGRRIYLNRHVVDADQLVVLGQVAYDPVFGYSDGLTDLFPWLSNEQTRAEFLNRPATVEPSPKEGHAQQEAHEVGWLLGMPFLVQVIGGPGDAISHVLAGAADSVLPEGRRLLDSHWRMSVERAADLVVAGIGGDPRSHTFGDVCRAMASAARVVRPGGVIVVLCGLQEEALGTGPKRLQKTKSIAEGLRQVREQKLPEAADVWQLATAANRAKLHVLSKLPAKTAESLFMIPAHETGDIQRMVNAAESCLFVPDAHRTLAVLAHG